MVLFWKNEVNKGQGKKHLSLQNINIEILEKVSLRMNNKTWRNMRHRHVN